MPGETFVVSTLYRFSANFAVLDQIAKSAATVSKALDDVMVSVDGTTKSLQALARVAPQVVAAFRDINASSRGLVQAIEKVATTANFAEARVASSFDAMGGASVNAATAIDESAASMVTRLESVTAAARMSAASIASLNRVAGANAGGAGAVVTAGKTSRFAPIASGLGTVGALGSLAVMAEGLHGAANLQDASIQTGVALGRGSQGYVNNTLVPLAMQMSMSTAQSVTDSMGLLRTMATSGINDPATLQALAMPIARFADTQYLGKNHVAFDDSAAMATQLSHQFGARTSEQMAPILNTLFKISQDMPDSLKTAATQLKFYAPQFTSAGVGATDILSMQAAADRLGLGGGRSGTGFRALLSSLQNPSSKKMYAAQNALGLLDARGDDRFINQKTGAFAANKFFDYLNQQYDVARKTGTVGAFNKNLLGISTSGAGSVLSLFSSDAGKKQRDAVKSTLGRVEDLDVAQIRLMGSLNNQLKLLKSNFATLTTVLAGPLIKPLTTLIAKIAEVVGAMATYLSAHHALTAALSAIVAGGAVLGVVKLFRMLGGFSLFIEQAAHHARGVAGLGSAAIGGGGHAALGIGIGDVFGLNIVSSMKSFFAFAKSGIGDLAQLGPRVFTTRTGLALLAETFGKLGLRAIPVVGNIMLIVEALRAFVDHSFDIGVVIGKAARWIHDTGAPLLWSAIKAAFSGIGDLLVQALLGFRDTLIGIFTGSGKGGLLDVIHNLIAGIHQGYNGGPGPGPAGSQKRSGGPGPTPTGSHRSPLTAAAPAIKHLDKIDKAFQHVATYTIPVIGELFALSDGIKYLGAHSFDIGLAIGRAARWIKDKGLPMLVSAWNGFNESVYQAGKAAIEGLGSVIMQALAGLGAAIKGGVAGLFTGNFTGGLFDNAGKFFRGIGTGLYGATPGPNGTTVSPQASARSSGAGGGDIHVHGDVHVRANDPAEFATRLRDTRTTNAAAGSSPVSFGLPAFSTTGLGTGRH